MNKTLITFILIFVSQVLKAQLSDKVFNKYFLKYDLYPINISDFFVDVPVFGKIKSIKMTLNDTINYKIIYENNKVNSIQSDSVAINLSYRLGKLWKIEFITQDTMVDKTKIIKLFPFIWIFNDGLRYTCMRGFRGIHKMKELSGFKTFSKVKVRYRKKRVYKIKNYGWRTVAQKCYFDGYKLYDYPGNTVAIERIFDANDSLAMESKYAFDNNGNIIKVESLIKKRASGWGIDITYYAYDDNKIQKRTYDYVFDKHKNWIERYEFLSDTLQNKIIRKINYRE